MAMTNSEKPITVPAWILDEILNTLRVHRNVMVKMKETDNCLFRRTSKSMNWLNCYLQDQATDENLNKISSEYITGELIKF